MEYRRLGNSGLQVSVIGLGTNNFGPRIDYPAAERVLRQAVDAGINFIETSNTYGEGQAEAFIGKALRGHRTQVLVATKVASNMGDGPNMHGGLTQAYPGAGRPQSAEDSRPITSTSTRSITTTRSPHWKKPSAPWTIWCSKGKCATLAVPILPPGKWRKPWVSPEPWGSSRWSAWSPSTVCSNAPLRKNSCRVATHYNLGILPYFPLASGFLTGKYRRDQQAAAGTRFSVQKQRAATILTPENFDVLEQLESFAAARSHPLVELAFAWLLAHPQVSSVIAGATTPEQITATPGRRTGTSRPRRCRSLTASCKRWPIRGAPQRHTCSPSDRGRTVFHGRH